MPSYGRNPARGLLPRTCPICGAEYQPYRASQRACSRQCHRRLPDVVAKQKEHKRDPVVRQRKNERRRVANNPERREVNLARNLSRYGITIADYEAMVAAQGNRCAICGDQPDPNGVKAASRLHVDHCHASGANRALLCGRCNMGLGYFRDNPEIMRAAIRYLAGHANKEDKL